MALLPSITSAVEERMIVAAIDIGTTYTGFAFSFRHEFYYNSLKVNTNLDFPILPTCILFSPSKEFDSFGYEAEDRYANLAIDNQHHDWYYFRRFKMKIYENKTLNRELMLLDDKGLWLSAMDIFSESIGFFVRHMLQFLTKCMSLADVHWVLTVPATCTNTVKQFMREAAFKAGIHKDNLSFAFEPEAASLFCQHLLVEMMCDRDAISCFSSGSKYLVVDAGGGTIDITALEVEDNRRLKVLYKSNDSLCGGINIDDAFTDFLSKMMGEDVFQEFIAKHRNEYNDLIRNFEVKKGTITTKMDNKITFRLPISLYETFRERRGQEFQQSQMANHPLHTSLRISGFKLRVDSETFKFFFKETCSKIVDHLHEIFRQPVVAGVNTILMVGGFSGSPMLRYSIEQAFKDKKVIVPNEASLSVLNGAIIFGHTQMTITSRDSKSFDKNYHFTFQDRKSDVVDLFTSNYETPRYTDDKGCTKLGTLTAEYQDEVLERVEKMDEQTELGGEPTEKNILGKDCTKPRPPENQEEDKDTNWHKTKLHKI